MIETTKEQLDREEILEPSIQAQIDNAPKEDLLTIAKKLERLAKLNADYYEDLLSLH